MPQLPSVQSMTIAVGFVCQDGLVIGVDSEYTEGASKYSGQKIFSFYQLNWSVTIAGAGNMDLVAMIADDLKTEFTHNDGHSEIHEKIKARTKYFFDEYVDRVQSRDREFQLLIGVWTKNGPSRLYKVHEGIVTPVLYYDFIGVGRDLARSTSAWIFDSNLSCEIVAVLARHILELVKECISGCGDASVIAIIEHRITQKARGLRPTPDEPFFWGLHKLIQPILIGCVDATVADNQFEENLKSFVDKMNEVRCDLMLASKPTPGSTPSSGAADSENPS
jgi:20S proteasome alpha/beta subunit